jgi:hypothetical protein
LSGSSLRTILGLLDGPDGVLWCMSGGGRTTGPISMELTPWRILKGFVGAGSPRSQMPRCESMRAATRSRCVRVDFGRLFARDPRPHHDRRTTGVFTSAAATTRRCVPANRSRLLGSVSDGWREQCWQHLRHRCWQKTGWSNSASSITDAPAASCIASLTVTSPADCMSSTSKPADSARPPLLFDAV